MTAVAPSASPQPEDLSKPFLRAATGNGAEFVDPSEDALFMMVEDVMRDDDHLIVESLLDPGGTTYTQAIQEEDGRWRVEVRNGPRETHVCTIVEDYRAAHALLTGWAFDVPGWADAMTWEPVVY